MERAVVLLSGGLDSATCLAMACQEYEIYALTFDYGSKHSREIESAKSMARHFGVKKHNILKIDFGVIGGSSLIDKEVPDKTVTNTGDVDGGVPPSYVPARNMTFLSLGVALAEAIGASRVYIGANAIDYSGYPDCRPEFIAAFQEVVNKGTKTGIEGQPVKIVAPLLNMSKSDIVIKGRELGVPFKNTWTCYIGGDKACGKCEACVLRLKGFKEAGFDDPLEYD